MNPQAPTSSAFNNGQRLNPQQVQQLREQAGISSISKPSVTPSASNVQDRINAIKNGTYGKSDATANPKEVSDVPGADTALVPANKASGVGQQAVDALKTVPNALGDAFNIAKELTYGTAKRIVYDIPKAFIDLSNENGGGLQGAEKAFTDTVKAALPGVLTGGKAKDPGAIVSTAWSMVPQSAKELINTGGLSKVPEEVQALAKDKGGYANAFLDILKQVPESLPQALVNMGTQLDRSRQAFENHPVNETLGYMAMLSLVNHVAGGTEGDVNAKADANEAKLHDQNAQAAQQIENSKVLGKEGETLSQGQLSDIHNEEQAISDYKDTPPTKEGAISSFAKNPIETLKNMGAGLRERIAPKETLDETVGKVAQGDAADVPKFKEGLTKLDQGALSKVKTYSDLNKLSSDKITELSKAQDNLLDKDPTPRKVQQLAIKVKSGGASVLHNYVIDAVDQLKQYYDKTNNVSKLADIKNYERKLNPTKGEGLTLKEINNLARMHGQDLNGFNANGELASGLSKVNAENTRSGLKATVRSFQPDNASKSLDRDITNLYKVKGLTQDMADKVNTLTQRLQKPNILQKIGGTVGRVARVTGVGDLASKLLGIDKVPGAKTLDPVELESRLSRNLEKINNALNEKDDASFIQDIKDMLMNQ